MWPDEIKEEEIKDLKEQVKNLQEIICLLVKDLIEAGVYIIYPTLP